MTAKAQVPDSLQWSVHLPFVWYVQKTRSHLISVTTKDLKQRGHLQGSPDPVFCDEQYDWVNPVVCAVARAVKQRAAIAANMAGKTV